MQPVSIYVIEQSLLSYRIGKEYNLGWATFLFTPETSVHYLFLPMTPDLLGLLSHCGAQGADNCSGSNYEGELG